MKKIITNHFLFSITVLFFLTSCKKSNFLESSTQGISEYSLVNLKNWYSLNNEITGLFKNSSNNIGIPDWNKTAYLNDKKTFITPINIEKSNENYHFFLISKIIDDKGLVFFGKYAILKMNTQDFKNLNFTAVNLDAIEVSSLSSMGTSAIVYLDSKYRFMNSSIFENGKIDKSQTVKIVLKPKTITSSQSFVSNINTSNVSVNDQGDGSNCTDWYWETYGSNGEVLSSVYLFTTCNSSGGGGSGGGVNGTENPLDVCLLNAQSFVSAGFASAGGADVSIVELSPEDWNVSYTWNIFTALTWGLSSKENASLKKIHYGQYYERWEFQSFTHCCLAAWGMNIGGSRTFADQGASINMTGTHQTAWVSLDFSVTSSAVCSGSPFSLSNNYSVSKTFYAP